MTTLSSRVIKGKCDICNEDNKLFFWVTNKFETFYNAKTRKTLALNRYAGKPSGKIVIPLE